MKRPLFLLISLLAASKCLCLSAFAGHISPGKEFYLSRSSAGQQRSPALAYARGAYLAVWQEGRYGWGTAEVVIKGAIIPAASGAEPSAAFTVSAARDIKEAPVVATDGINFFVVWQDFRNGKDYDVFGARVTPEGKVLDPAGVPLVQGTGNQSSPSMAFDGTNFVVAWMDNRELPQSYAIRVGRVARDGTSLDFEGVAVAAPDPKDVMRLVQSETLPGLPMNSSPKLACLAGRCLVGWLQKTMAWADYPRFRLLDTRHGIALGGSPLALGKNVILPNDSARESSLAIAACDGAYFASYSGVQGKGGEEFFIVGIEIREEGTGKAVVRPLEVRPISKGQKHREVKLSENVAAHPDGVIVAWAEGRRDVNDVPRFSLRALSLEGGKALTIIPEGGWSETYVGSPVAAFAEKSGVLLYERIDPDGNMRIRGVCLACAP